MVVWFRLIQGRSANQVSISSEAQAVTGQCRRSVESWKTSPATHTTDSAIGARDGHILFNFTSPIILSSFVCTDLHFLPAPLHRIIRTLYSRQRTAMRRLEHGQRVLEKFLKLCCIYPSNIHIQGQKSTSTVFATTWWFLTVKYHGVLSSRLYLVWPSFPTCVI